METNERAFSYFEREEIQELDPDTLIQLLITRSEEEQVPPTDPKTLRSVLFICHKGIKQAQLLRLLPLMKNQLKGNVHTFISRVMDEKADEDIPIQFLHWAIRRVQEGIDSTQEPVWSQVENLHLIRRVQAKLLSTTFLRHQAELAGLEPELPKEWLMELFPIVIAGRAADYVSHEGE